ICGGSQCSCHIRNAFCSSHGRGGSQQRKYPSGCSNHGGAAHSLRTQVSVCRLP
ncbi:hypothetical protein KI387_012366, partial [Taxus chinensis]